MATVIHNIDADAIGKSIGEWVKANTIAVAERALREEVGRGFDNQPVVVTDGTPRRDYLQVKPFGKIEFIRRPQMAEAVLWALNQLQKRSPVKTGNYKHSHTIFIDGVEVEESLAPEEMLLKLKDGQRVQIVNKLPYAKKIEGRKATSRGRGASRVKLASFAGQSKQAPRGVYERVVLPMLVRRYGRSMFFDFKYVKLSTGLKVRGLQGGGANRRRVMRDAVYPSLHFFIKPTGAAN